MSKVIRITLCDKLPAPKAVFVLGAPKEDKRNAIIALNREILESQACFISFC